MQLMWEREAVGAAIYLKMNADQQVQGAVRVLSVMEETDPYAGVTGQSCTKKP